MSISITVNSSRFQEKVKRQKKQYKKGAFSVLTKNKNKIVRRAKMFHRYKNRTGRLTRNTRGKVNAKSLTIRIYNDTFYAIYVQGYTNNKWMLNAINYYRADLKRDIQNIPKKFFR